MDSIEETADAWHAAGKTIVFTNGCFDLVHPGHIRYLRQARELGDLLVLGLNTDGSVKRLKGPGRPILTLEERSEVLLALRYVHAVVPFAGDTPLDLIRKVRPHVLVKGGDWAAEDIVGREIVEGNGGRVLSLSFHAGISTSDIIDRIRSTLT
jgi:rfaE bifunctional protein nucleotidyltransferase chain/domain